MKEKKSMLTRVLVLSAIIMICLVFMASCAKPGDSDKQQENGSSQTDADTENKGDDPSEKNEGEIRRNMEKIWNRQEHRQNPSSMLSRL